MGSVALSARRILPLYVYFSTFFQTRTGGGWTTTLLHSFIDRIPSIEPSPSYRQARAQVCCLCLHARIVNNISVR